MTSLRGKTVVFSGTLQMKRADATARAQAAGATVAGSVSSKTDVLVAGEGAGSKMDTARANGVAVWTEAQFAAAVDGSSASTLTAPAKSDGKRKLSVAASEAQPAAKRAAQGVDVLTISLRGKTVVFTGTLPMKRADAIAQAQAAGATVVVSVSGKTDVLVAGEGAGSKMDAARAKGVAVLTEAQFTAAVGGAGGGGSGGLGGAGSATARLSLLEALVARGVELREDDDDMDEDFW